MPNRTGTGGNAEVTSSFASGVHLLASLAQVGALFTPAVRVRLVGSTAFLRLEYVGAALLILALASLLASWRRGMQWRATLLPPALSLLLLVVTYWKIEAAPSGTVLDPLLRHGVHAAWGFVPMMLAVLVQLAALLHVRRSRTTGPSEKPAVDS